MKRKMISLAIVISIMLTVVGCGTSKPAATTPDKPDKLVVMDLKVGSAPGVASYPLAYMSQNDSHIIAKPWKTYDQLLAMITAKEVNLSSTPITNAMLAYNKGFKVKLLNVAVWGMIYVMSTDPSIKSLQDLKGKQVAVTGQGGIHDLVFRHLLIQNGLKPDQDVTIIYLDLPESSAKLISGEIKAAVLNEPNASMALLNAKKSGVQLARAIDLAVEWGKLPGQTDARIPQAGYIIVEESGVTNDQAKAFASTFNEAAKWVNKNPDQTGPLVEKQAEWMKAPAVSASLKFGRLDPVAAADCRNDVEAFFTELGKTAPASAWGGKMPDDNFFFQN